MNDPTVRTSERRSEGKPKPRFHRQAYDRTRKHAGRRIGGEGVT
jgi:hypothetical protein